MAEHEPPKILEADGTMPIGVFAIVTAESEPVEGVEGKFLVKNTNTLMVEDSSLGSLLIGLGIIKHEVEAEREVIVFKNEADEIQWPDNIRDAGEDDDE